MRNIITKFKAYLARPKGFRRLDLVEKATISALTQNQALNDHILALARLSFIKPENLYREANNNKANTEYMLKLLEIKKGGEGK
jgi:hypothetical protein